jgi:23S rRNA (adenine-N6)-dimethyltransferase
MNKNIKYSQNFNIKYSQNFLTSEKVLNQIIKQLNLKETVDCKIKLDT